MSKKTNYFRLGHSLCASMLAIGMSGCEPQATAPQEMPVADSSDGKKQSRSKPPAIPDRLEVGVPESGVELGMGWDSSRGEVVPNNCLNFAAVRSTGQSIEMDLSKISDQSEMLEKMNVSASVAVKSIIASGSAKASFAKKSKMSSNSTTLLLTASANNSALTIAPPNSHAPTRSAYPEVDRLPIDAGQVGARAARRAYEDRSGIIGFTDEIKALTKSPEQFRRACGDYFVASIQSGAQMYASFTITSSSKEESQKKAAEISASYGVVSGGASASSEQDSKKSNAKTEVRFMQIGGGGGLIPMSEDNLEEKLRMLAVEAERSPKFHTMELRSYREIPGSENLLYASTEDGFETVADYYWFLTTFANDIDDIIAEEDQTKTAIGLHGSKLVDLKTQVIEVRRAFSDIIDAYLDDEMPDADIIEAAKVDWFKTNDKAAVFGLDLDHIDDLRNNSNEANIQLCGPTGWFGCFVRELQESVPYGNPNTLRLLLPIRSRDSEGLNAVASLKIASVWHHVGQQSDRMCDREPQDNECLTPAELKALEAYIPVNVEE